MHTLETYTITFDPETSTEDVKKIFKSRTASILWCAIKTCHITDQYFNKEILETSKLIDSADTRNYQEFLKLCKILTDRFGLLNVFDTQFNKQWEIDHEFWSDIFKAILRMRVFKTEIEAPKETKVFPELLPLPDANMWEGCGDHSCKVRSPIGVGTNGGCRCYDINPKKTISQLYLDREYFRNLASKH